IKRNLISSNCFAGIMFDVQNFVSFTNSRLATENFIDYVLLVQFSRFIMPLEATTSTSYYTKI
ncbi:hypothetical protein ACQKNC_22185, partial [Lysinibacillus sp. NPDC094177]|uniref:hypothetical protein n=1 Tax=Lysinibacillus sp. NPDC094177 TaxID=3390580 RepID=UPI003D093171